VIIDDLELLNVSCQDQHEDTSTTETHPSSS
jgi:hypothetical protein